MIFVMGQEPTRLAPTTSPPPADPQPGAIIAPRPAPLPEPLPPDDDPQSNGMCPPASGWPWWTWVLIGAAGATALGLTFWAIRR